MDRKQIEVAYNIAAKVVAEFGDAYLPIFERLHAEMQKLEKDSDIKSLALKVALGYKDDGSK